MSHLPTERLAAFVDETPSHEELAHLAACAECARERAMFQSLADLAMSEPARIGSPLTSWESLRPALVADGVIDQGRGLRLRARQVSRPWMQAAAAVLLVAGGTMFGRYSATGSLFVADRAATPVASTASTDSAPASAPRFASLDEARRAQEQGQMLYQSAAAFIASQDTVQTTTAAKRVRLAALDRANQVFGAAMTEAPNDPVITGAYLTTAGQREATLRQLNVVAPASMRMTSY
jgi:hypothetical protein